MSDRGVILKIATTGALRDVAFDEAALRAGVKIGRHADCSLAIDGSELVSAHHANLSMIGDTLHLKDLNSTNGTFLDGDAVDTAGIPVHNGQVISLGHKGPKISVTLVGFGDAADGTLQESFAGGNMTRMLNKAGKKLSKSEKAALKVVAKEMDANAKRSRMVLLVGILVIAIAVTGVIFWQDYQSSKKAKEQEESQQRAMAEIKKRQSDTDLRVDDASHKLEQAVVRVQETALRVEASAKQIDEMNRKLGALSVSQRDELAALKINFEASREHDQQKLEERIRNSRPVTEIFRDYIALYQNSVFLIYTEIPLMTKDGLIVDMVGGFGTGWVADDGLVVTNKHVIFPHRFNESLQELKMRSRELLKDDSIEWNESRALVAAWSQGSTFRNANGDLDLSEAWVRESRSLDKNRARMLRICYIPPDDNIKVGELTLHDTDSAQDLAILHFKGLEGVTKLPMLPSDELSKIKPFASVMALGYPRGASAIQGLKVLTSPVSGTIRKNEWQEGVISTSVPIIPGNSGGPLIDEKGRVIGVTSRGFETMQNDAITIDKVHKALEEGRKLKRVWPE